MVNNFLITRDMDSKLNITNICMIPKTERPTRMSELRPISLCNVGYKIISKVFCQIMPPTVNIGDTIRICTRKVDFG